MGLAGSLARGYTSWRVSAGALVAVAAEVVFGLNTAWREEGLVGNGGWEAALVEWQIVDHPVSFGFRGEKQGPALGALRRSCPA